MKKKKIVVILIYIVLVCAILITLMPLGWILSTSLKSATEVYANPPYWIPKNITLEHYISVIFESQILNSFYNSFIVGITAMTISLICGGAAGYAFARYRFRGNKTLSLFMLLSQMLPITVLMIPMYYMQNSWGLIDTKIGLALAHLVITMPLVTWMAKGYFKGIPKELEEAALVDGCNSVQSFSKVIFPLLKPGIAATGIYAFISSWNDYAFANVLTRTDNSKTLPIGLNEFSSYFEVDWGATMAAAAITTLPIIIIFMLASKQFIEGLSSGAVKG